jgi:hypothetical protein
MVSLRLERLVCLRDSNLSVGVKKSETGTEKRAKLDFPLFMGLIFAGTVLFAACDGAGKHSRIRDYKSRFRELSK